MKCDWWPVTQNSKLSRIMTHTMHTTYHGTRPIKTHHELQRPSDGKNIFKRCTNKENMVRNLKVFEYTDPCGMAYSIPGAIEISSIVAET